MILLHKKYFNVYPNLLQIPLYYTFKRLCDFIGIATLSPSVGKSGLGKFGYKFVPKFAADSTIHTLNSKSGLLS